MFGSFSLAEWIMLITFVIGIIGFIHRTLSNQRSQEEALGRLTSSVDELRLDEGKRISEYKLEINDVRKNIDERIRPLEIEVKHNATFIASQGATLNSINTQLQNLSVQINTLLTRTWDKEK